jgi:hypothetical protein
MERKNINRGFRLEIYARLIAGLHPYPSLTRTKFLVYPDLGNFRFRGCNFRSEHI